MLTRKATKKQNKKQGHILVLMGCLIDGVCVGRGGGLAAIMLAEQGQHCVTLSLPSTYLPTYLPTNVPGCLSFAGGDPLQGCLSSVLPNLVIPVPAL